MLDVYGYVCNVYTYIRVQIIVEMGKGHCEKIM